MNPFLPWIGGKRAIADKILKHFPNEYDRYIEVFGGGAAVLFAKKAAEKFEVYNDYNGNLVNLFQVVRDKPFEFLELLHLFPLNSRKEFTELKDLVKGEILRDNYIPHETMLAQKYLDEDDFIDIKKLLETKAVNRDVQRAVDYYKLIRYSYGNQGVSYCCKTITLTSTLNLIRDCSKRLEKVIIENKDFEDLIRIYDRPSSFFYCDPPYFKTEAKYEIKFKDHERLRDTLFKIKGKWLLSYNDCPEIRELYKGYSIYAFSRQNNLKNRYESKPQYHELLIANYDFSQLNKQFRQMEFQ